MRIVFATDLHGSSTLYGELAALVTREQPRVLALGGDLFRNKKPYTEDARRQRGYVENALAAWVRTLAEQVPDLVILAIPGNHGWNHAWRGVDALTRRGLPIHNLHERLLTLDDVTFTGYGCTPPSVFPTKDYERWDAERGVTHTGAGKSGYVDGPDAACGEGDSAGQLRKVDFVDHLNASSTMAEELERLPRPGADCKTWVFVAHSPPWNTGLDHMWGARPIGSQAVLAYIEREAPTISLHGHVHEAPEVSGVWRADIGKTLSINPGRESPLAAAILDTEDPRGSARHTKHS